jgi:hypothetical protein
MLGSGYGISNACLCELPSVCIRSTSTVSIPLHYMLQSKQEMHCNWTVHVYVALLCAESGQGEAIVCQGAVRMHQS